MAQVLSIGQSRSRTGPYAYNPFMLSHSQHKEARRQPATLRGTCHTVALATFAPPLSPQLTAPRPRHPGALTTAAYPSTQTTTSVRTHAQGKDAVKFLEGLVVGDVANLKDGTGSLSVFTNEQGGIIDDTVITKVGFL